MELLYSITGVRDGAAPFGYWFVRRGCMLFEQFRALICVTELRYSITDVREVAAPFDHIRSLVCMKKLYEAATFDHSCA
jgi:hypothetical protein